MIKVDFWQKIVPFLIHYTFIPLNNTINKTTVPAAQKTLPHSFNAPEK
jgi:hypothetical protein